MTKRVSLPELENLPRAAFPILGKGRSLAQPYVDTEARRDATRNEDSMRRHDRLKET
jgi:hypothetical protein